MTPPSNTPALRERLSRRRPISETTWLFIQNGLCETVGIEEAQELMGRLIESLDEIDRLRAENFELRSKMPLVDSNGHYCDGMSAAWSDAQKAIADRDRARAENARLREALEWYANPCGACEEMFQRSCHGSCERARAALAQAKGEDGKNG